MFPALRIDVNQEFEVLESFLTKLPGILHRAEERDPDVPFRRGSLVKYYFKEGKKDGLYSDVANDVIRPSAEECQRNPRRDPRRCAGRSVRERIPIEINVIRRLKSSRHTVWAAMHLENYRQQFFSMLWIRKQLRWQALRMRFC